MFIIGSYLRKGHVERGIVVCVDERDLKRGIWQIFPLRKPPIIKALLFSVEFGIFWCSVCIGLLWVCCPSCSVKMWPWYVAGKSCVAAVVAISVSIPTILSSAARECPDHFRGNETLPLNQSV
jgi:hypothetical protein